MWSVVIVDQSGAILEVLVESEPMLSGAMSFAAGFGNPKNGVLAIVPSQVSVSGTASVIASAISNVLNAMADRPQRIALDRSEAAAALGVTVRTIEGMIDRGEIRAKQVGKKSLIPVTQLEKLFQ
jgi:excisionase family DNA binding protein